LPPPSPGPDDQEGAPIPGIGAEAGAGAAAVGVALRGLAFLAFFFAVFAAGLRAALFFAAFFFFRAGAARFIFLVFDFDFDFAFDFFARLLAMIVLPIVAAQFWYGATRPHGNARFMRFPYPVATPPRMLVPQRRKSIVLSALPVSALPSPSR
jgi:hypothetical protein